MPTVFSQKSQNYSKSVCSYESLNQCLKTLGSFKTPLLHQQEQFLLSKGLLTSVSWFYLLNVYSITTTHFYGQNLQSRPFYFFWLDIRPSLLSFSLAKKEEGCVLASAFPLFHNFEHSSLENSKVVSHVHTKYHINHTIPQEKNPFAIPLSS